MYNTKCMERMTCYVLVNIEISKVFIITIVSSENSTKN